MGSKCVKDRQQGSLLSLAGLRPLGMVLAASVFWGRKASIAEWRLKGACSGCIAPG